MESQPPENRESNTALCESDGQPTALEQCNAAGDIVATATGEANSSSERPATVLAQIIVSNVYKVRF